MKCVATTRMLPNPFHISDGHLKTADCWYGTHPGLNKLYSHLWENTRLKKILKKKMETVGLLKNLIAMAGLWGKA